MYKFIFRGNVDSDLKQAAQTSPSLTDRLEEMNTNPLSKAKNTEISLIGEYYVNAGRWCILFDVDSENEKIEVRSIVSDNLLYKLLKGKIPIPEKLLQA